MGVSQSVSLLINGGIGVDGMSKGPVAQTEERTDLTVVKPAMSVRLAWTVALTVRSTRLSLLTWSSHEVSP